MWLLKKYPDNENDQYQYYLIEGCKYLIGRKDCDIILAGDASISRKHAFICIGKITDDLLMPSDVTITDTSKVGVQVNGGKIPTQISTALHEGDVVSFGKMQLKFKLVYKNLVSVMSCINSTEMKDKVKSNTQKLGGNIKSDWAAEATHLIMEKLVFTIKVVCALACGKWIVTPKFLEDMLDSCDKKKRNMLPLESEYLPPVTEHTLINQEILFSPNAKRKTLFVGKVFITIAAKQYKRMKKAVECAGGSIVLKETRDLKLFRDMSSNQTIVLCSESKDRNNFREEQKTWMSEIISKLKSHHLRTIKESEIGLAILHVSLESYCNPTTSTSSSFAATTHTQTLTDTMVATQLSPSNALSFPKKENYTKSASTTCMNEENDSIGMKRKRIQQNLCSFDETSAALKKSKLASLCLRKPNTNEKTKSASKRDIITIDDDDDDFNFGIQPLLKVFEHSKASKKSEDKGKSIITEKAKKAGDVEILEGESLEGSLQHDTPKTHSDMFFTPQSKKAIPDTFLSSKIICRVYEEDEYNDPFMFDIHESSCPGNVSYVVGNDGQNSIPDGVSITHQKVTNISRITDQKSKNGLNEKQDEIRHRGNESDWRFKKAALSSQEASSEEVFVSDSEGNMVQRASVKSRQSENNTDMLCDNMVSRAITKDKLREEDNNDGDMSYLLDKNNDKERMFISEEFLPSEDKQLVPLKGFLSTVNKKSTVLIPKEDPDLDCTDRDLVTTEFAPLVINTTKTKQNSVASKPVSNNSKKVKNFKVFKKQFYAGKGKNRKKYIKDFVVFESENEERIAMFADFRQVNDEEEKESRSMDQLFHFQRNERNGGKRARR
ncbi:nibrin-like isoform X2 [Hydractinia symbiolongicarpus]|nr:nibrin-like isoform X2 [Hydractinia symbiolongicarpus]XP_057291135.1 nibrin-like isoform X2 [Hydractinia symbiolongicarpus]